MANRAAPPGPRLASRVLAPLALLVAGSESVIVFLAGAPALHRWLAGGLVAAVLLATRRTDPLSRAAWLAVLSGTAFVSRATVRFDVDLAPWLAALDASAAIAAVLTGGLGALVLSRALGARTGILAALAGVSVLVCVGLVLERSPGARLGLGATTLHKGPWPHRTFGQWYPPRARVRSFYAANPRGYLDEPAPMPRQWLLNLHSATARAELRFDPNRPTVLRTEIARATGGQMFEIQLNQPIAVRGARAYELRFSARADRPRQVGVGISEWHTPYEGLGYYETIALEPAWTHVAHPLTLDRDDGNARIHFDIGNDDAAVEIADVVLFDTTTGQRVQPDPTPYSLTHQFNDVGCRGADAAGAFGPGTRRLLILGDSYALGLGVRDTDLFGEQLARLLQAATGGAGAAGPVHTMTCAVPGWGARQERQFYEWLRGRYPPDLVIVATTWNDGRRSVDEAPPSDGQPRDAAAADVDLVARELRRLADLTRGDGARLGVVLFRNTPDAEWERMTRAMTPLQAAGVPVLDLWPALNEQGAWETLLDGSPARAPNEIAHGRAARAAAAFVQSAGLVR